MLLGDEYKFESGTGAVYVGFNIKHGSLRNPNRHSRQCHTNVS